MILPAISVLANAPLIPQLPSATTRDIALAGKHELRWLGWRERGDHRMRNQISNMNSHPSSDCAGGDVLYAASFPSEASFIWSQKPEWVKSQSMG